MILVKGLRNDSRIALKLSGQQVSNDTLLLAEIVDLLSLIWWSKTKDGQSGRNRPKSVFSAFQTDEKEKQTVAFSSSEEFDKARERILKGG